MADNRLERLMRRLAAMQYENRLDRQLGDQPRWSDEELETVSDEIESVRTGQPVTSS